MAEADTGEELLRRLRRLATDVGPALVPATHRELLQSITDAARQLFGAAACSLALLSDDEAELVFEVASGAGVDQVVGLRIGSAEGIAGWVVSSGQAIAIEDAGGDPRFAAEVARGTGYVPATILAMPLETGRRMLGAIEVLDPGATATPATGHDMALLAVFARQAALAIEGARIFGDLGRTLLTAAAESADRGLGEALLRIAGEDRDGDDDLAALAALFCELGDAGPGERRLVTALAREVLAHARSAR